MNVCTIAKDQDLPVVFYRAKPAISNFAQEDIATDQAIHVTRAASYHAALANGFCGK